MPTVRSSFGIVLIFCKGTIPPAPPPLHAVIKTYLLLTTSGGLQVPVPSLPAVIKVPLSPDGVPDITNVTQLLQNYVDIVKHDCYTW